jgi:hypothetical protein
VPLVREACPTLVRALCDKWEAPFSLAVPALVASLHHFWSAGDKLSDKLDSLRAEVGSMRTEAQEREQRSNAAAQEREQRSNADLQQLEKRSVDMLQALTTALHSPEVRTEQRAS